MNEMLLFAEIIVVFSLLLLAKKFFGKTGLILWIALASIIANLQLIKNINIFGISATLGNVMFASNFLATDMLSEYYSKKDAKKAVFIGVFGVLVYVVCSQFALIFKPNNIDFAQGAMETIFSLSPRICLSSITMYLISNLLDVHLYERLKTKFNGKKIWLRNNISTILCNCLENFGFAFLAFAGIYSIQDILMIAISTSVIEIIIALCDTPFLYLAKRIKCKEEQETK